MGPKQHHIGHRSLFTLEWDDEDVNLSEKRKPGKSLKENLNAHRIPESRHNRNGQLIRPLMQTLPYSLVKPKSSSSPPQNSIIHTYTKNHQTILNQSHVSGYKGRCLLKK